MKNSEFMGRSYDMNRDLTQGKPEKVLWSFCLPLFGSIIFQQLYNIADSLIAGKFVGENALAAVGNSYEITLIFIAFAFGCNIGCSVIVSGYFGAKEYHHARTAVHTTLIGGGILCVFLMLAGFAGCSGLLELIHTPEEIMADSRLYLMIYIAGLPFLFFYNIATGIFSALGDSKTPFFFLACSSTANIAMDYAFVKYLQMGVSGVAWATFICQGISCVLALIVVFRHLKVLKTEKKAAIFSSHIFRQICVVAVPSILQQSFISIGNIVIQSLINGFGPAVIAGYAAAIKLNNLVITSFTTLGNGISNYTAQNLGAGKYDRIHSGFRAGLKLVWLLCLPIILVYITFGKELVFLFMDNAEGPAIGTGILILRIFAPFYLVVSAKLVADGILRGASLMSQFMTATFTDLILRVLLAAVFSRFLGSVGIWSAWPIGWLIGTAVSLFFYNRCVKKKFMT